MRIERLEIDGFGCLRDIDVDFSPQITAITALNESGKSTLHAAVLAAMFGFFNSGDQRRDPLGKGLQDKYKPWDGGRYGLKATFRRSNEDAIVVSWDFSDRSSFTVTDDVTGADLTTQLRGGADSVLSATEFIGVGRDFFSRACFVGQRELVALDDDDRAVSTTVESLASSGSRDASAQRALELIDSVIHEDIGTDRATVQPLPKARSRVSELTQQLDQARKARHDLEQLAEQSANAAATADELEARAQRMSSKIEAGKLVDLQRRLDGIDKAQARLADLERRIGELSTAATFSIADETEIVAMISRRRETIALLEPARKLAEGRQEDVSALEQELRDAEGELSTLQPYKEGPGPADAEKLAGAVAQMQAARAPTRERIDAPEQRPQAPVGKAKRPAGWLVAASASAAAAVASGVAGVIPLAGALAVAAFVFLVLWLRVSPSGAEARLEGRLEERDRIGRDAEAAIDAIVVAAGYDAGDREAAVARFRHDADQRQRLSQVELRVQQLRGQLSDAKRSADDCQRLEGELRGIESKLASAFERCSITESDLTRAEAIYESKVADRRRYDAAAEEKRRCEAELSGLLAGRSGDEIEREASMLKARGVDPLQADREADPAQLESDLEQLERQAKSARAEANRLLGECDRAARGLPEVASLEEALAAKQDEVAQLQQARDILALAQETLEQAAEESYRDVAPRLNKALGENLARVTAGRYTKAYVDQDFSVKVDSSEAGRPVDVDELSDGTRDQIYLIERLELARVLGTREPLPIFLDDPLKFCDEPRRKALADILAEASQERQIIVISTDRDVLPLLSDACEACVVVDLDELKGAGVPVASNTH